MTERATGREVSSELHQVDNVEGSLVSFETGIFASVEDLRRLAERTLNQTVDRALDHPSFRNAIR